jgi:hypothetical protein
MAAPVANRLLALLLGALVLQVADARRRSKDVEAAAAALETLEPSAAALERAAAHIAANPPPLHTFQWLGEATDAARGHKRWGHTLDAGSGANSMSWLCGQPTESVVAVTAAKSMRRKMKSKLKYPCKPVELLAEAAKSGQRPAGRPNVLLVGNWFGADDSGKPPLTEHPVYTAQKFDTVLAEYLLGALEHFAAFNEQKLMDVLAASVVEGGLLLFCGRVPFDYPGPAGYKNYSKAEQIVLDTERIRDASMLLSHQREYREFPPWWVVAAIEERGLEVVKQKEFRNVANLEYVTQQLQWAAREAKTVPSPALAADLIKHIDAVQAEADADEILKREGAAFGGSYCLVARKLPLNGTTASDAAAVSGAGGEAAAAAVAAAAAGAGDAADGKEL